MPDAWHGEPAPIALFVFKRPEHTRRTLEALARNPDFERSPLHVYCDGARRPDEAEAVAQVRAVVREWPHARKTIVEAPANRGLARSIIDGVTALCDAHGRVIVVEDDLVVAPVFLDFMNRALDRYRDESRVMQISGHMFSIDLRCREDAVFLPFATSWGWATWSRAWNHFDPNMLAFESLAGDRDLRKRFDLNSSFPYFAMLERQRAGKIDSWAILWYLSVFSRQGLVLYPSRSLVQNEGFDGSGTHSGSDAATAVMTADLPQTPLERLPAVALNDDAYAAVTGLLKAQFSFSKRALRWLRARLN